MFPTLFGSIITAVVILVGTEAIAQSAPFWPRANASIPLPNPTLLAPPPDFDCTFQAAKVDGTGGEPPRSQGDSDAALRRQLDYERQCYRHAEMILRDRLLGLQAAVAETIEGVNRGRDRAVTPPKQRMTDKVLEGSSTEKQPHLQCNVAVCARFYRSFDRSDCTYRPYGGGTRKTCNR